MSLSIAPTRAHTKTQTRTRTQNPFGSFPLGGVTPFLNCRDGTRPAGAACTAGWQSSAVGLRSHYNSTAFHYIQATAALKQGIHCLDFISMQRMWSPPQHPHPHPEKGLCLVYLFFLQCILIVLQAHVGWASFAV